MAKYANHPMFASVCRNRHAQLRMIEQACGSSTVCMLVSAAGTPAWHLLVFGFASEVARRTMEEERR